MKSKIFYGVLAIALAFSLSACGIGAGESSTNGSETTNSSNSKPSTDLAAVNKAYNDILNEYGITPHSSNDTYSTDYLIEDIIGDSTPELIIYGDFFEIRDDSYRNTKDIYGYDNNNGETFQYKGETQIVEPHKGKDNYCIGGTYSEGSLLYSIYEASGGIIKLTQKIHHDISNYDSSSSMYIIGDKTVSKENFKNELSKYMDISSLPKDIWKDSNTVDNTLQFKRTDYFTGTKYEDLLRNPDNNMNTNVYLPRWIVYSVPASKLYYAYQNTSSGKQYISIDDSANSGTNAMVGDTITVYGEFVGNDTALISNMSLGQMPKIISNLLIVNNILPTDEDFTGAFIETLNAFNGAYGYENQYISAQKVKLLCKVDQRGIIAPYKNSDTWDYFYVDGYNIANFIARKNEKIVGGQYGFDQLPVDILDGNLYWISGMIHLDYVQLADRANIDFEIENIEPYN